MQRRNRWGFPLALVGAAIVALGLWDRMQACEPVASDVFVCSYTAVNYLIAGFGAVLFVTGLGLAFRRGA